MLEYQLAGNPWVPLYLGLVLLVSWYALSDCTFEVVLNSTHAELNYAFLACPVLALAERVWQIRRRIDEKQGRPRMPLSGPLPRIMIAEMCSWIARERGMPARFYLWMASKLRATGADGPIVIAEIPQAWRRTWSHWIRLSFTSGILVALAVFLASPWQYYLGNAIAQRLDRISAADNFVRGGEICQLDSGGVCVPLRTHELPGDVVELRGDAPEAGRLRLYLRNWPRAGRYVHFRSEAVYLSNPRHSGIDLDVGAPGRQLELPYFANDTSVWALWAELEYFSWDGTKLVTATYSGTRVPRTTPPDRYR